MTSRRSEHPQRARLVVRVGVTGHRAEHLEELDPGLLRLRRTVRHVLERIQEITRKIHKEAVLYAREEPLLQMISPVAEGADRLVAEEALALGYELQCPLPFAREEYEKDFASPESKREFHQLLERAEAVLELPGDPVKRPESYLAAGRVLLMNCDVLLALWDGKPARGKGGTSQVVDLAQQLDLTTIWIEAHAPHEARLWQPGVRADEVSKWVNLKEHLSHRLHAIFLLPPPVQPAAPVHGGRLRRLFLPPPTADRERVERYLAERPPKWDWAFLFQLFRSFWSGRWKKPALRLPDVQAEGYRRWGPGWEELPGREAIERKYLVHFDWADTLAQSYAGRYRSSFLTAYLLGAGAILVAFLGVVYEHEKGSPRASTLWFSLELAFILVILLITVLGRRQGWHERWMDYRLLAEALRPMEFLALIGGVPPSFKVPVYLKPSDPRRSWSNWYFRALVRQAGLVGGRIDRGYLESYRKVLETAIEEQVKYHHDNHETFEHLHRRPHLIAQLLFLLAACACALHLAELGFAWLTTALSFCAIVLPAIGAAFGAILHHGEFERVAIRSHAIGARLAELHEEAQKVGPDAGPLGRIAEEFADVMMAELVDWRFVFLDKNLILPA